MSTATKAAKAPNPEVAGTREKLARLGLAHAAAAITPSAPGHTGGSGPGTAAGWDRAPAAAGPAPG